LELEGIDTAHTDGLAANIQTDILLPLVNRQQSNQFLLVFNKNLNNLFS
jgi:uncharacterized protein YlaN (UPF0358 family)